ncbi:MAG TPA: glycosyltransferase, partial [Povalibacter sp.]|nr:glycosyltransferase [Povalibacter sp.]
MPTGAVTQRPPLVVHVIYRLDYGGLENGLVNLINAMPAQLCRHAIVCLAGFSEFRRRIRRDDVEIYSLDKRPGKDFGAYLRFWKLLRRLRPTVVHTRNLGTIDMQWISLAAGARHRIHGEHGWDAADPQGANPRMLAIRRACRPAIHAFVAVSADIARWLASSVRVASGRIHQIYNGVNTDTFNPEGAQPADLPWPTQSPERPVVFATVGRLNPIKNQGALLAAFARLVAEGGVNARLTIVGDGPSGAQ